MATVPRVRFETISPDSPFVNGNSCCICRTMAGELVKDKIALVAHKIIDSKGREGEGIHLYCRPCFAHVYAVGTYNRPAELKTCCCYKPIDKSSLKKILSFRDFNWFNYDLWAVDVKNWTSVFGFLALASCTCSLLQLPFLGSVGGFGLYFAISSVSLAAGYNVLFRTVRAVNNLAKSVKI